MNIEWWMIDGGVALIFLIAALRGAVKGVGDTIIRILCIVGGIALGIFCKDEVAAHLMRTRIRAKLYNRFFALIRGNEAAVGVDGDGSAGSVFSSGDTGEGVISKSIGNIFDNAADRAADAAAERLTQIAMGVIAFALIILAVCILAALLRLLIRMGERILWCWALPTESSDSCSDPSGDSCWHG